MHSTQAERYLLDIAKHFHTQYEADLTPIEQQVAMILAKSRLLVRRYNDFEWVYRLREDDCSCREPRRHEDCTSCGYGCDGNHICGLCMDAGIDGPVIRGTERRTCRSHREHQDSAKRSTMPDASSHQHATNLDGILTGSGPDLTPV
jgi:hypothetical protein